MADTLTTKQIMKNLINDIKQREDANKNKTQETFIELEDNIDSFINAVESLDFTDKATIDGMAYVLNDTCTRVGVTETKISNVNDQVNDIKSAFISKALVVSQTKVNNSNENDDQQNTKLPVCDHVANNNLYDDMMYQLKGNQIGDQEILCQCPADYPVNVYDEINTDKHVGCAKVQCNYGAQGDDVYLHYDGNICYVSENAY